MALPSSILYPDLYHHPDEFYLRPSGDRDDFSNVLLEWPDRLHEPVNALHGSSKKLNIRDRISV
jgi:hypothetical protein